MDPPTQQVMIESPLPEVPFTANTPILKEWV